MMLKRIFISVIFMMMVAGSFALAADDAPKGNIHPNFKLSFSERFRFVSWDNTTRLGGYYAPNSFTRTRTSVMGQWYPSEQFELGLKFTNEFRYYFFPKTTDFTMNEVFVDQLYVKGSFEQFTVTVGRQNLFLGEGFVVWDGGPLDGSRSAYFNAARLDVMPCPEGVVSLFYFYQPVYDDYMPLIHDEEIKLVEDDEQGFGGYISRNFGKSNVQAYYIRKNVIDTLAGEVESGINTAGARLALPLNDQWSFTAEGAYQFGTFGEVNRKAFGGYGYVDYRTNWPEYLPAKLTAGGVYLSGDDIGTEDYEGWDPLFGRWPKWSESYIYTLTIDSRVAGWTNYANIFGRVMFDISSQIEIHAEYQHLLAPVSALESHSFYLNGEGSCRGDMLIGKLTFNASDQISGHLLWEYFNPGDYYREFAQEANWLRFELMLKVQ